jgi:hypothetical protein
MFSGIILIFQDQTTNRILYTFIACIAAIGFLTLTTLALAFNVWKLRKSIQKENKELQVSNQDPAEQDYEDSQTVIYENTEPSTTFSPNHQDGANEEYENRITFSLNPYYGTGE